MVVNAPDSPVQAEVIFVIESTAANGAFIGELKTNYILPTLEYFHGGPLEESGGCGSVYSIVTYKAADCHPSLPVSAHGPFQCPQGVVDAIDRLQFIGGHAENRACVTEALTTALTCVGRNDVPIHIILVCCSPPYSAYAGGFPPPGAPATIELAARLVGERGAQLSVMSARRVPALVSLYEHAGGELLHAHQRNYAKDPRHLVLLRGYSLKERPPSPAPPPAPEIQADPYGQGRGAGRGAAFSRAPAPPPRAWLPPPPPRALYSNNSALLTQLAQPSYPPPAQAQSNMPQNMPRMPMMAQPSTSGPAPQRNYIWSGVLEWMEKGKAPGDQQKVTKHLPCQVSASSKDIEPELKVDTWPNKLLMQLMPKHLISSIGGQYLKDSKSVLFHLQPNEALDALTKVLVNGFAGCVHFSPMSSPPQCDIKVLILLYTPEKKAYLGFIPNNQGTFVDRLRKVIQQQKITQIINKQLPPSTGAGAMQPNMATNTMAGTAGMSSGGMSSSGMPNPCMSNPGMLNPGMSNSGMPNPGMSNPGMPNSGMSNPGMQNPGMPNSGMSNPGMPNPGMSNPGVSGGGMSGMPGNLPGSQPMGQPSMQQHNQSMMMSGQTGGPRATQLDGLEAARQQNLEKIQQLQQTLEAAHQQDAMFKSQMDIMSHLQAAQQQEQHYKMQMEEKQRQHQLQQQLQQQLRGNAAPNSRMMRPLLPSNPGLRHLLQQQPQYRPGGGPVRPTTQSQQFDDVNSYNDFL